MRTITIATQKGGAGKTALARNLAVAASQEGSRVLLLDLDPQQTLRDWWKAREADAPEMLDPSPPPSQLKSALTAAGRQGFDLAIIDTPPAAPTWLSDALEAADLVLIPVRPSPDDLRAVGGTLAALKTVKTPFAFVMSQTPRAKITVEAARVLAQHGRVAPTNIAQRIIYAEIGATGQGVTETTDIRGAQELWDLWAYVKGVM